MKRNERNKKNKPKKKHQTKPKLRIGKKNKQKQNNNRPFLSQLQRLPRFNSFYCYDCPVLTFEAPSE